MQALKNALANVADLNMRDYLLFDQDSVGIMAGAEMGVDDVPEEDAGIQITASLDANAVATSNGQ